MKNGILPSSRSTGGAGHSFENRAQSIFTVLMLTGGHFAHFPYPWRIVEIQFQTKSKGYATDDLLVIFKKPDSDEVRKLLLQIKVSIKATTQGDDVFMGIIKKAWADFNNDKVFQKKKDSIALFTETLNSATQSTLRYLFKTTRYKKNPEEIRREIDSQGAAPSEAGKVLEIFRNTLQKSNNEKNNKVKKISDDDIFDFVNHFHIFHVDSEDELNGSVSESLLINLISQFHPESPKNLLARIRAVTQTWNENGGTLTVDVLPDEIKEAFKQKWDSKSLIPANMAGVRDEFEIDKSSPEDAMFLARVALAGAWDDKNKDDQSVVAKLLKKDGDYAGCSEQAQRISGFSFGNIPLVYKGNKWKVKNRDEIMQSVGKRFIDSDIEVFMDCAINVLGEKDPAWDFPPEERYMAGMLVAPLKHSHALRNGIAEGLAILAKNSDALKRCQPDIGKDVAKSVVWNIFSNADAAVWGGINDLLPILAEAAPQQFLEMVRNALNQSPCPFDELFAYEGDGITSKSYGTGIIWAMGILAWNKEYLVGACMALGKMAYRESGYQRENRPLGSLVNILLPSTTMPKPRDSWDQRKIAAKTLLREFPNVALEVFLDLLPRNRLICSTNKPRIRTASEERVLREQYVEEVRFYSELIAKLAVGNDLSHLTMIADNLAYLPENLFSQLAKNLKSPTIVNLSEDKKLLLWKKLMEFISDHRYFDESKKKVALVEEIAEKLAPVSDFHICQSLFGFNEGSVLDGEGDAKGQWERLYERRDAAIEKLFNKGGVEYVIHFFNKAECDPYMVGYALGSVVNKNIDQKIFPDFLENSEEMLERFAKGIIIRKLKDVNSGWEWLNGILDGIDKSKPEWSPAKIGCLLAYFPLSQKAGDYASDLLGDDDKEYWSRVGIKTNLLARLDVEYLPHAVEKIIEYGSLPVAVELLGYMLHEKRKPNANHCVRALLALSHAGVKIGDTLKYYINGVVNFIQSPDVSVDKNDIIKVEWAFLGVGGITPKYLGKEIACCAEFFCEMVRLAYPLKEDEKEHSQHDYMRARNAWNFLQNWKTIPGLDESGYMNKQGFKDWFQGVKEKCKKEIYWKISLEHMGKVLAHAVCEKDDLWINRSVAEILNEDSDDAEIMRNGFNMAIINSRGPHWVDPTGEPERKLAEKYKKWAERLNDETFGRFAEGVKKLADHYESERKRVIDSEKDESEKDKNEEND